MNSLRLPLPVALLIAVFYIGCSDQPRTTVEVLKAEPWISKPRSDWPQLVLTNRADFEGHSPLFGASSFLIRTEDGRVLAGTAAHLIGEMGGVEPEIPISQLTSAIRSWRMYPRTMPDRFVNAVALAAEGLDRKGLDWLILAIDSSAGLPCYPLRPRREPIGIGDSVFLVGCPYSEPDCVQNVYAGVVTERKFGNRFRFSLQRPVNLMGFSGAPILDAKGYLVGVMTIWFEAKMSGDEFLEGGGEDIPRVRELWKSAG